MPRVVPVGAQQGVAYSDPGECPADRHSQVVYSLVGGRVSGSPLQFLPEPGRPHPPDSSRKAAASKGRPYLPVSLRSEAVVFPMRASAAATFLSPAGAVATVPSGGAFPRGRFSIPGGHPNSLTSGTIV